MATRKDKTLRPQLITLFNLGAIRELTDGQLLERFVTDRSEMAELAFAALVERHSAMVMRVCRARLASLHDAQDAFQATFLILVKKARTLWVQDSLGPWLHQVALRTATCARDEAARRKRYERQAAEHATGLDRGERSGIDSDLSAMLHEAIDRLPERYRVPIILCDLEGRSCEDAARRMGRPVGTVKSWRARGRARLRQRLIQVGLAPSATWESTLAADLARAAGPKPEAATVRAATQIQANPKTTGDIPASVYLLIKGVMKTMILSKFRAAAAFLCAFTLFAAGLGTVARVAADDATAPPSQPLTEAPNPTSMFKPQATPPVLEELGDEIWQLTLPDAIRIGLEASEGMKLVKPANGEGRGNGYEIVPLATDLDEHQFKARIMAFVRSIAEQYSSLGHQYTQQAAYQKAVELTEEVLKREEAFLELGTGTTADVAEARQRLEQFKLDLATKASDLITTHQSLQGLLGVPDGDSRRIVPVTAPIEVAVSPDWETSLATMLKNHPDIARSKAMLTKAEDQFRAAELEEYYKALAPGSQPQEKPASPGHSTRYQSAQNELLKRRESHQKLVQQATHSLSRFRLELDANHKQFQKASQIQTAAVHRLAAQRAFREEGRITIDRYLDAIAQHASAAAQAAQFKSMYNVTLTSWAEILGTLLEREKITISQRSSEIRPTSTERESTAAIAPKPQQTLVTPMDRLGPMPTPRPGNPVTGRPVASKPNPNAAITGKSLSFEMTIAFGSKPITLKGSFTIKPAPSSNASKAP